MRPKSIARRSFPALAALLMLILPSRAGAEFFVVESFRSDILVGRRAGFTVRETIQVNFTSPRHGIYRDLPFRYTDELGKKMRTPLDIISVTDEKDEKRKHKVSRAGDAVRIRIGHPRKYVQDRQVYIITYRVENALLFYDDHDELYWNVTGSAWDTPIKKAVARISVEGGKGALGTTGRCFTGSYGSVEKSCSFIPSDRGGVFTADRPLKPREGFTVALGWDKGVIRPPSALKKLLWKLNLAENWVFLIPVFSFLFMFTRWQAKGRDPDVGSTVAVVYTPPEGKGRPLLPGEIGSLTDDRLDNRDITASIVNLAVKGYLTIEEVKDDGGIFDGADYRLERLKPADDDLPLFEGKLLNKIFSGSASTVMISDLKHQFYTSIPDLKETVTDNFRDMGYYTVDPSKVKKTYFQAGFVLLVGGMVFSGFLARVVGGLTMKVLPAFALAGAVFMFFAPIMPAKTRKGALALRKVRGFEEFLTRAEKDRLERMADKNLFEKYLPYAIALDVSDRWAAAFEGIYQEEPRWYVSSRGPEAFRPASFNRSLGTALASMGETMYAAPRSSGSGGFSGGGGGFSGGGFGGGGGGSW